MLLQATATAPMPTARRPAPEGTRRAYRLDAGGRWAVALALATAKLAAVLLCQCASMPRPTVA